MQVWTIWKELKLIPCLLEFQVGLDLFLNKVIIQSLNFGIIKVLVWNRQTKNFASSRFLKI